MHYEIRYARVTRYYLHIKTRNADFTLWPYTTARNAPDLDFVG